MVKEGDVMNFLILMGRGTEGCGQTRTAIEIHNFLESEGHNVTTISNTEKKWGREKAQENEMLVHNFKSREYTTDEKFDHIIIASVPAKNYSQEGKENFTKTLENLDGKITYVNVDHKIHSLTRNYYAELEYMDRFFKPISNIVTHDLNNDLCVKFLPKLNEDIKYNLSEMMFISCDFDSLEDYRLPVEEKIDKLNYFIGRAAFWKGPVVLRDFHYNNLKSEGYTTILEGVERSIGFVSSLYKQTKPTRVARDDVEVMYSEKPEDHLLDKNKSAMFFGPYIRKEALKRLAKAKFGMFFTFIGENYGGPVENTLMEIVGVGTVPVIRKELFDTGKFVGARFTDFKPEEIGFIIYDQENPEECVTLMNKINGDNKLYEEYREKSLKFLRTYFDRKRVLNVFLDIIQK